MSIFNKFGTNIVIETKQVTIEKIIGQSNNTPYWISPIYGVNHPLGIIYQDVEPDPHVTVTTTSPYNGPFSGTRPQTLTRAIDLESTNSDFNDTREIRLVSMSIKGDLDSSDESISNLLIGDALIIDEASGILDNITDYQVLLPKNLSNIDLSSTSLDPTKLTSIEMNEGDVEVKCTFGTNISDENPITLLLTFEYDVLGNIFNEDASNDPYFIPQLNNKDTLNVENAQNNADFLNYRSAQPFVVDVPRLTFSDQWNMFTPLIPKPIHINDFISRFYPNSINPTQLFKNHYQVIKNVRGQFWSAGSSMLNVLHPGEGYLIYKKTSGTVTYNLKMHEFFGLETPEEYISAMNSDNASFTSMGLKWNLIGYPKKNLERNKYVKTIDNTNAIDRSEGYIPYEMYKAMFGPNNPYSGVDRYEDPNHPLYLLPYGPLGIFSILTHYDFTNAVCVYILWKYFQVIKNVSGQFASPGSSMISYFTEGEAYMVYLNQNYPGMDTGFRIHSRVINPLTTNVSLLDKQNFLNL